MSIKQKGKIPYGHLSVPLSAEELAAFGAYIVRCGLVESQAAEFVAALSDLRDDFPDPADIFTTGMALRGKMDLSRKIARRAFPDNKTFQKKVDKYTKDVESVTELRNNIAHAKWMVALFRVKETDEITARAVALQRKRHTAGYKDTLYEATVEQLEAKITETVRLEDVFTELKQEAAELHGQRRAALQPSS